MIAVRPPEVRRARRVGAGWGVLAGLTAAAAVAGGVAGLLTAPEDEPPPPRPAPARPAVLEADGVRLTAPAGWSTGTPRFRLTGLDARAGMADGAAAARPRRPPARPSVAPSRRPGRAGRARTRPGTGARGGRRMALRALLAGRERPHDGHRGALHRRRGDARVPRAGRHERTHAPTRRGRWRSTAAPGCAPGRRPPRRSPSPRCSAGSTRAAAPRARRWRRRSARRAAGAPRCSSRPRMAPRRAPSPRSRPGAPPGSPPLLRALAADHRLLARAHAGGSRAPALRAGAAIERREQRLAALLDRDRPAADAPPAPAPPHSPARRAAWRSPSSSAWVRNAVIVASSSAVKRSASAACHSAATGPQISPRARVERVGHLDLDLPPVVLVAHPPRVARALEAVDDRGDRARREPGLDGELPRGEAVPALGDVEAVQVGDAHAEPCGGELVEGDVAVGRGAVARDELGDHPCFRSFHLQSKSLSC